MNIERLKIQDVLLVTPKVFKDDRGYFFESFSEQHFFKHLKEGHKRFVQDNESFSIKGVLRGLHYQTGAKAQGKLVRCVEGEIFDVAIDLRKSSLSFGQWVGAVLSRENFNQLWLPEGFAHGFLVLSDTAKVLYKATDYYDPTSEGSLIWNDPEVNISWPKLDVPILLSDKDLKAPFLKEAKHF